MCCFDCVWLAELQLCTEVAFHSRFPALLRYRHYHWVNRCMATCTSLLRAAEASPRNSSRMRAVRQTVVAEVWPDVFIVLAVSFKGSIDLKISKTLTCCHVWGWHDGMHSIYGITEIPLMIRKSIVRNLIVATFMEGAVFFPKICIQNVRARPYKRRTAILCSAWSNRISLKVLFLLPHLLEPRLITS